MTDRKAQSISRLVERAEATEEMSRADADAILKAHQQIELLGRSEFSVASHEAILMRMCTLAKRHGGLADALENRNAAEALVRAINRDYDNPETNKRARTALRTFGRLATDGDDVPDSLDWVPSSYPSTYDPSPNPGEMYRWEDHVKPMIEAAQNARDEALVALCWDLGPRTSELYELQVNDLTDSEYGLRVHIENGKNGSRTPTLIPSTPYVRGWLQRHPGDGDDYLWTRLSRPDRVSKQMLRKALRELADRADMTPPSKPTPTRFRKSSASYLASQGVSQPHLEDHHGWVRGSDQAARYIAVFGDAADRAIASAHGADVEVDAGPDLAPLECPRCGRQTPRDEDLCVWCGAAQHPEAAEAAAETDEALKRELARLDGEQARALLKLDDILDDPALRAALLED